MSFERVGFGGANGGGRVLLTVAGNQWVATKIPGFVSAQKLVCAKLKFCNSSPHYGVPK